MLKAFHENGEDFGNFGEDFVEDFGGHESQPGRKIFGGSDEHQRAQNHSEADLLQPKFLLTSKSFLRLATKLSFVPRDIAAFFTRGGQDSPASMGYQVLVFVYLVSGSKRLGQRGGNIHRKKKKFALQKAEWAGKRMGQFFGAPSKTEFCDFKPEAVKGFFFFFFFFTYVLGIHFLKIYSKKRKTQFCFFNSVFLRFTFWHIFQKQFFGTDFVRSQTIFRSQKKAPVRAFFPR